MALEIPNLAEAKLVNLTACGEIRKATKSLHEWASEHEETWIFYRLKTIHGPVYSRVGVDNLEDHVHLHIDVALKEFFAGGLLPRTSKNVPGFDEVLSPFAGQNVAVTVVGDFSFPLNESPVIVPTRSSPIFHEGGISIRLTAGTLSLEGLPIDTISWTIDGKKDRSTVEVKGPAEIAFSDKYLLECLDFIVRHAGSFFGKKRGSSDDDG